MGSRANAGVMLAVILCVPTIAHADAIRIKQTIAKSGANDDEIGYPRIVVQGEGTTRYDRVLTSQIDAWVTVTSDTAPEKTAGFSHGSIKIESASEPFQKLGQVYKVTFPYAAPKAHNVANQRVSPIELCNDRLASKSGSARETFLRKGEMFNRPDSYEARVSGTWWGSGFRDDKTAYGTGMLGVAIDCRPLLGPKVRSGKATTTGTSAGPRARGPSPTRTNPPPTRTNPAPVRTNPAPVRTSPKLPGASTEAANFDARIRGGNRQGPGGTPQLWVYNAGPDTAQGCEIEWHTGGGNFVRVATLGAVAASETKKVESALPANPNSEFRVSCPNEPASATGNNGFTLP